MGWGGIKKDATKAMELYRRACDLGNTEGCTELGDNYARGHGVRQDYKKAMEFFGKACDLGEQKGCDAYKEMKTKLNSNY
ncbi:tetratricopeptide repeat protein [Helicobacter pullorum]|uniref:tetratricopeptide repeat protein n=1 Tax=Helicobacter pullorum TaxID=35818 RepID=UPI0006BB3BB8|nr:tetratricopeptide repeat protein [Helicobacter pullorum]HJF82550.1 sel1 repeat family protein [Helicobacter pullorum]